MQSIIYTDQIQESTDEQGKKHINQFTILKTIGKGAFSKVKKVLRAFENKTAFYAMKIMHKPTLSRERSLAFDKSGEMQMSNNLEKVYNEIDIWAGLMHPNIVRLFELIDDDEKDYIYLVMELIQEGQISRWDYEKEKYVNDSVICADVRKYLQSEEFKNSLLGVGDENQKEQVEDGKKVQDVKTENVQEQQQPEEIKTAAIEDQDIARFIFKDVLEGVEFLHQNLISHRDLKLDNILYSSAEHCSKVSDFTVSKRMTSTSERCLECQGTTAYMAPEFIVIGQKGYDPFPIDIWSFGVSVYIFMTGKYPFEGDGQLEMQLSIRDKELTLPQTFSDNLKNILKQCLQKDPTKRPSATQLLEHQWFKFKEELQNDNYMNNISPSDLEQLMKGSQMQIENINQQQSNDKQ